MSSTHLAPSAPPAPPAPRSVRANAVAIAAAQMLAKAAGFATLVVLTRALPIEDFGRYTLAIDSPDDWQSRRVRAGLYLGDRGAGRLLWQQDLPHEFGPRHSLVGNGGQVVLIDEAINTASRYAVMVIDRHGTVVATHDFDAVAAVLGLPVAAIVEQARGGSWWVAGAPVLDAATATVRVPAAGRYLGIELDTGRLLPPTDAPPAPGR